MKTISICFRERGKCQASFSETFGLGGALAYKDPGTGKDIPAAYLSKVDCCYLRREDSTPFAGIEFKNFPISENKLWYKINSSLPQTLCALSGHLRCVVGLLVTPIGFAVTWRQQSAVDEAGLPVYDYFMFPGRTEVTSRASTDPSENKYALLRYCYSPDGLVRDVGADGREDLLRVMFQIALASFTPLSEKIQKPIKKVSAATKGDIELSTIVPRKRIRRKPAEPDIAKTNPGSKFGVRDLSGEIAYLTCFEYPKSETPENETSLRE